MNKLGFILVALGVGGLLVNKSSSTIPYSPAIMQGLPELKVLEDSPLRDPFDIMPWPSEKLNKPITLKKCPGLQIIEWRPENITKQNIDKINDTCHMVRNNLSKFLKSRNLKTFSLQNFNFSLSLIPDQGKVRNINDYLFRFKERNSHQLVDGYTSYTHKIIFINSDLLNKKAFATVLAHELFHAYTWHSELFRDQSPEQDESNARYFTKFLGLGV